MNSSASRPSTDILQQTEAGLGPHHLGQSSEEACMPMVAEWAALDQDRHTPTEAGFRA